MTDHDKIQGIVTANLERQASFKLTLKREMMPFTDEIEFRGRMWRWSARELADGYIEMTLTHPRDFADYNWT